MSNEKNTTEANQTDAAIDTARLLGVRAIPLNWRRETVNTQEGLLVNYFSEVFCGKYCISYYEHDIWMVTGIISGMKADRFFGLLADCQIWASDNWSNYILSSVEKA